ncbi:MAG TPA: ABC-F family ATP-binding cassette domain-containing protein, partial [Chitinophagaceae bacterium]|nr:ABC-F family ATP-binding cassette domain-containing protein [Chitinophagaceae bacterium]
MLAGFTNVTFEFGARVLVEDATWHIQPGERIGLIGYNGTGKSTLLKLLVGEYTPSAGTVERSRNTTIGYLHQDLLSFDTNDSILQVALGAFEKVLQLEKEIEVLGKELERTGDEKTLHEYSDKLHELETLGGYNIHHRTEEVLQGLGFANADLSRPYKEFSGGWRMRVLLAKMILQQPDLLLLDEPTNHLDLPSIEWLEKYLLHYQGSVVIVSHDKYFLNRMVTKIVELYQEELHFYSGNYEYYEQEKELRLDMQQKAYSNQQDYIRQNERLVERFRAKASKAAMAQSLIKKLDKLDRIEEPNLERPNIKINFRIDKRPGKSIVKIKHASKSFGDIKILENAEAEIIREEKIALIGANGKGKSTVLRMLAGTEPFEGEKSGGHNVDQSFYAQHQLEALNSEHTIMQEMMTCGSQKTEQELRTLLGCFLFSGDDVSKKIKILSGGEKARVALAKTIISRANFLLLDEPTNHLDIHSVELMIEALNRYEGSYILVSHDRYFISKTASKIWEIIDYKIKEFAGGYDEYAEWKERKSGSESGVQSRESGVRIRKPEKPKKSEKENAVLNVKPLNQTHKENSIDKDQKKEIQKQQKLFQQLEEKIATLNKLKAEHEAALADPATYSEKEKFLNAEAAYKKINEELLVLNKQYEQVFEKIVKLESK